MIDLPLVDTHLHLWDPGRIRYPWLDEVPLLNRPHLLDDYNGSCRRYTIDKMVFVQCEADPSQYRAEVEFVTEQAAIDPRIGGIVAWAPLEKGDAVRPELEALKANPLVRGIRRIIQFEPDPAWCLSDSFVEGVAALADYDLTFDICIKGPQQTANTIKLVQRCPDVTCIVDHIGKPYIADHQMEPWATHMKAFAALPNVWCKMSGLVVEADMKKWTAADLDPYIRHTLECFGDDRVMFGGDWPVVLQAAPLWKWIETLDEATADAGEAQRAKLFRENAIAFYRLA